MFTEDIGTIDFEFRAKLNVNAYTKSVTNRAIAMT